MEQAMREQINFFTTEDTKCLMKSNKCLVIKLKQTQWFNWLRLGLVIKHNQTHPKVCQLNTTERLEIKHFNNRT